jgi:AcrR family transcriptional regulator
MTLDAMPNSTEVGLSRVERKRTRKMRDILMAAAEVLNRDGYHAMSLDDVAEKMDLTKATLYHYFGGKDELVAACLTLVANEVTERLRRCTEETADLTAAERLRRLLAEQLTILLIDYPEAARPFSQQLDWPPEHSKLLRSLRQKHDELFRSIVTAGVETGEFGNVDPNIALHCIYGAMNYAPVWVRSKSRAATKRVIDGICDAQLKMLAPRDFSMPSAMS